MNVIRLAPFAPVALLLACPLACQSGDVSLGEPEGTGGQTGGETETTASPSTSSLSASPTSSDGSASTGQPTTTATSTSDGKTTDTGAAESDASTSETTGPLMGSTILYVNFGGATLQEGDDDARTDTTSIGALAGELQPFGGGSQPAEIVAELEALWADFDVAITDTRPDDGDYTMVVVTPTNPFASSVGIAPIDCDDDNANNIAFVFSSAAAGQSSALIARIVSREVAHTFGLEGVEAAGEIMNATSIAEDATFTDACVPLGGAAACPAQHAEHCAGGGQNSAAELAALTSP